MDRGSNSYHPGSDDSAPANCGLMTNKHIFILFDPALIS